jgi:hypothetical protein
MFASGRKRASLGITLPRPVGSTANQARRILDLSLHLQNKKIC